MDDQTPGLAVPPPSRRELRRREEAARPLLTVQQAIQEPLAPTAPRPPAASLPGPRSSPSGRVPQWVIDEADGRPAQSTAWRTPDRPLYDWQNVPAATARAYVPPRVRHRSPVKRFFRALGRGVRNFFGGLWRLTRLLVLSTVVLAVTWNVLAYLTPGFTGNTGRLLAAYGISNPAVPPYSGIKPTGIGSADGKSPPLGMEEANHRLGTPAPLAASSSSYTFVGAGPGQPFISFDPCRPIHFVVRPSHAPTGGDKMITEAVAAVSRATGFVFINDGYTNENPSADRPAYQPERYGNRWAPVLIAWETPAEEPRFTGKLLPGSTTTLGLGGSRAVTVDGMEPTYVTGRVRLNAAALGALALGPDGHETVTAAVKHELGHVVGLGHVADPTQLMAPTISDKVLDFGAGDLTGLALLGTGQCQPGL